MKNNDKLKNILKAGAILLGGTLILSFPASIVHNIDEKKRENTDSILLSQLEYPTVDVEKTLYDYFLDYEYSNILNEHSKEKPYNSSAAIVATGNQVKDYLIEHNMDTALIDGMYFSNDGRTLEVVETKDAEIIVKDSYSTYSSEDGYALNGSTYKKIKNIETSSYQELDEYALVKVVNVYYSDYLDTNPDYTCSYRLIKA